MAHEPCGEASRSKYGKKNIAWRGVGGAHAWAQDLQDYSDISSGLDIAGLECHSWACSKYIE
jgi:hypothetical protein